MHCVGDEGQAVCSAMGGGKGMSAVDWRRRVLEGWGSLSWQSMTDGEWRPYMNSTHHPIPTPQTSLNIRTVFVHLKRRGRGGPAFHKDRLIAGVVEWRDVGRGEVEEGWCCTLIPHIDLWPQHQPTCLEFHYRRRKTDGGRGASGSFWGLPPQ